MAKHKNKNGCMTTGCLNAHSARGLCATCYAAASGLVTDKKTTWEQLAKLGLAKDKRSEQSQNKFMQAFKAAFSFGK